MDEWGASYSSPLVAKIRGKEVLLVLAGGESRPANGGLLVLDPSNGKLFHRYWSVPICVNQVSMLVKFISYCLEG